jgi:hypothetical protein
VHGRALLHRGDAVPKDVATIKIKRTVQFVE